MYRVIIQLFLLTFSMKNLAREGHARQTRAAGAQQGAAVLMPPLREALRPESPPRRPYERGSHERKTLWYVSCRWRNEKLFNITIEALISTDVVACDECGYNAATKGMVAKHVQTVHRKEKPFECEICRTRWVKTEK